jgi:hypothetical protein
MARSESYEWADPEELLEPQEQETPPEQKLWLTVVDSTIREALGLARDATNRTARKVRAAQARAFIRSDNFRRVCELAGLDVEVLRDRVLDLIAQVDKGTRKLAANIDRARPGTRPPSPSVPA